MSLVFGVMDYCTKMTNIFQIISANITALITVLMVSVASILPWSITNTNKPVDSSTASPSAIVLESPSPSASITPTPAPKVQIKVETTPTPKLKLSTPFPTPSTISTSSPRPTPTQTPTSTPVSTPTQILMSDKPYIDSFCDNKGNCACSSFAGSNSNCSASSNNTIHVGETLNFTIKVSGEETSGILAFILPQEYDWVKEGGIKPWGTDLTYTKTFTTEDISTSYFMYAYIKSSNDNYHRRSRGCNWISYSCDDNTQIIYTVLP